MRKLPLLVHRFQQELKSNKDLSIRFKEYLKIFTTLKGEHKVKTLYKLIDQSYNELSDNKTSCKSGCHYCCFHQIEISRSELEYISASVKDINLKLNEHPNQNACPYLSKEGKCQIYSIRPLICRITYVSSPAENCDKNSNQIIEHYYQQAASMISLAYLMTEMEDFDLKDSVLN